MFRHSLRSVLLPVVVLIGFAAVAQESVESEQPTEVQPAPSEAGLAERDRLWEQALKLAEAGKTAQAIETGEKVLAIEREHLLDVHEEDLPMTLEWLSTQYLKQTETNRSLECAEELLRIQKQLHGKADWRSVSARFLVDYVQKLSELPQERLKRMLALEAETDRLLADGQVQDAIAKGEALRREEAEVLGEKHPSYATSLNILADSYRSMGAFAKAEPLARQAMEIRREVLGEEHPDYANSLNNLAVLYESMGDYAKAEPLARQAMEITKKALGEEDLAYATSLNNLAVLYLSMGTYAKAEPLFRKAMEIKEKVLGKEDADYARTLNNLAALYWSVGDYVKAEPLIRQAIEIRKKASRGENPDYANSLNHLAFLYESMGEYAKAKPLFQEAMEINGKALGEEHPDYANSLYNLAALYLSMRDYAKAEPLARLAVSKSRDVLNDAALVLSERQQLVMTQMLRYRLDGYLSLALECGQFQRWAVGEVLSWKGATLVRQRAMRLAADDPQIAEIFRRLQRVVRRLASLSRTTPDAPDALERWRERIAKLTAEKEHLEAQLSRDSAAFREGTQRVTLEQVQAALPANAVLVDFLQFIRSRPAEVKGPLDFESSLLACVVTPSGEPRLIELGPVASLSEAIDAWRKTLGMSAESQAAGRLLRKRVWEPLVEYLADAEIVLVSTDGVLGRLPLGALPGKKPDTYLIEDHRLAMIPVPQLLPALVKESDGTELSRELLMLGDVDYDANPRAAPPKEQKRRPRRRAVGADVDLEPLPGTKYEILAINDLYRRLRVIDDDDLETLRGASATEARFRELAPQFYHLHLATHGFFADASVESALSDRAVRAAGERAMLVSRDEAVIGQNPGLLSGLAFAGANREPEGDQDDGILTAQEIAFLPLGGVETVVLSACKTGLGPVAGGEGLLGVQRAFQIAGVRSTVASFWKVDDSVTHRLMDRFYRNLWKEKMTRLDALREAQLYILNNPNSIRAADPELDEAARRSPPRYWAAFMLSGDWR